MAVNKVVFGAVSIMDITDSTVTPETLAEGVTAYDKSGEKITGNIPSRSSSDLTASGATVSVPAGHYKQAASKSVATATQATPAITVDANGLITASATQSAGYVASGTKSATKQLTVETWTLELESGSTIEKVVVL